MTTRNSEMLRSFVDYCERHPDHRFWQAIRNWSGYAFVLASDHKPPMNGTWMDTFYMEGRNHHE